MPRRMNQPESGTRRQSAFTLVELLVVIVIIATLVLIALPRYLAAVYTADVRGCQSQIKIINTATQAFFARNHVWPETVDDLVRGTAPAGAKGVPLDSLPECPFGKPYHLRDELQSGTTGAPTSADPQVGVTVDTSEHFDGVWMSAIRHVE